MSYYMEYYSQWHNHKDEKYREHMKEYFSKVLHEYLPMDKNADILEIGCANGMAMLMLKDEGYTHVKGIDICLELVQVAKEFSLEAECVDAMDYLQSYNRQYDFIYMSDLIEHIPEKQLLLFLQLCYKALKPGGSLWILTPNANSPVAVHLRYIDPTHVTIFTPNSISYRLGEAGFEKIQISELDSFPEESKEIDLLMKDMMGRYFIDQKAAQITTPNLIASACKIPECTTREITYLEKINTGLKQNIFKKFEALEESERDYKNWRQWLEKEIAYVKTNAESYQHWVNGELNAAKKQKEDMNGWREWIEKEIQYIKHIETDTGKRIKNQEEWREWIEKETAYIKKNTENHETWIKEQILSLTQTNNDRINYLEKEAMELAQTVKDQYQWRVWFENRTNEIMLSGYKNRKKDYGNWFSSHKAKQAGKRTAYKIRSYGLFDEDYYRTNYLSGEELKTDPVLHYVLYGCYDLFNPSADFVTRNYILEHPNLLYDDTNPFLDYLQCMKTISIGD